MKTNQYQKKCLKYTLYCILPDTTSLQQSTVNAMEMNRAKISSVDLQCNTHAHCMCLNFHFVIFILYTIYFYCITAILYTEVIKT